MDTVRCCLGLLAFLVAVPESNNIYLHIEFYQNLRMGSTESTAIVAKVQTY
jgi:hypothetical protein